MSEKKYPQKMEDLTQAEPESKRLLEAHEGFSALMDRRRFQVVYPVLPIDFLGFYILLPE
jgi:hypothetical protein